MPEPIPEAKPPECCANGGADPVSLRARHWYVCERLSVAEIARRTGLPRSRVARVLDRAGVTVRPRGAGHHHGTGPRPGFGALLRELYLGQGLTSAQIGLLIGKNERTVRQELAAYDIPRRGKGHTGQITRAQLPAHRLTDLYVGCELSAEQVAARLGTSRGTVLQNAHDLGLPVRIGGPRPTDGPTDIRLMSALYADPLVTAALHRHQIRRVPADRGRLRQRFPTPVPLTDTLLADLYQKCGLATTHIELLTGQTAPTIQRRLHRAGIPMRTPGGRCPFLRRWRAGSPDGDQTPRSAHAAQPAGASWAALD
ncbi:hypothetical protein [Streptomyces sp. NPDC047028]|uniref:hypothetical protein n=1 Tax=Streptomyces sp. NPDC047028 TaxID=3155793 RepID=UPI0033DDC1FD